MKLIIREQGKHRFSIPLPNRLLLNGFVGRLIQRQLEREALDLGERDLTSIPHHLIPRVRQMLHEMKKEHPGLPLVEVQGKDGDELIIYP